MILPVVVDRRLAYIDASGNTVCSTKYDRGTRFRDGYAVVYKNKKAGLIDVNFRELLPCVHDGLRYIGDLSWEIKRGGELRICDQNGRFKLNSNYAAVGGAYQNLFVVQKKLFGPISVVDSNGKEIIRNTYTLHLSNFSSGLILSCNRKGAFGFRGIDGSWKIKAKFDNARPFSEGVAAVEKDFDDLSLTGFIDCESALLCDYFYITADARFSSARCIVMKYVGGAFKYGAINRSFDLVIDYGFEYISSFADDVAFASEDSSSKDIILIDRYGACLSSSKFTFVDRFLDGYCWVDGTEGNGYINTEGEYIWKL